MIARDRRACHGALAILAIVCAVAAQAEAAHGRVLAAAGWSAPVRLSVSGAFAVHPFVLADRGGALHVLWSESTQAPDDELAPDTIFYVRGNGETWSVPADVAVAPDGTTIRLCRARIRDDRLHLVAVTRSAIVYAHADAAEARSARGWAITAIGEGALTADMALSDDGAVDIVYVMASEGIFHVRSTDAGATWSDPHLIALLVPGDRSSGSVRLEVGADRVLHAVWGITAAQLRWQPAGIGYARSADGGHSWDTTFENEEGDSQPIVAFDDTGALHLLANNPAGSRAGRGYALSLDGGLTWSPYRRAFAAFRGQTYWPAMSTDSAGTLHLIFSANPPDSGDTHAFHARWLPDGQWSEPVDISAGLIGMEGPSLAVSLGNRLNVVWFTYTRPEYGIWYTSTRSDAPAIAPAPTATARSRATAAPERRDVPARHAGATPTADAGIETADIGRARATPWLPVAVGLLPVIGIIAALFALRRSGSSRHP